MSYEDWSVLVAAGGEAIARSRRRSKIGSPAVLMSGFKRKR
jgi:hypothetical protein